MQPMKPVLLTRMQVAEVLNLCERSIFSLDKSGALPSIRIGSAVRYRRSDVEKFAEHDKYVALQPYQ